MQGGDTSSNAADGTLLKETPFVSVSESVLHLSSVGAGLHEPSLHDWSVCGGRPDGATNDARSSCRELACSATRNKSASYRPSSRKSACSDWHDQSPSSKAYDQAASLWTHERETSHAMVDCLGDSDSNCGSINDWSPIKFHLAALTMLLTLRTYRIVVLAHEFCPCGPLIVPTLSTH